MRRKDGSWSPCPWRWGSWLAGHPRGAQSPRHGLSRPIPRLPLSQGCFGCKVTVCGSSDLRHPHPTPPPPPKKKEYKHPGHLCAKLATLKVLPSSWSQSPPVCPHEQLRAPLWLTLGPKEHRTFKGFCLLLESHGAGVHREWPTGHPGGHPGGGIPSSPEFGVRFASTHLLVVSSWVYHFISQSLSFLLHENGACVTPDLQSCGECERWNTRTGVRGSANMSRALHTHSPGPFEHLPELTVTSPSGFMLPILVSDLCPGFNWARRMVPFCR